MIAAGENVSGLYFHPSGKYIFAVHTSTNEVPIVPIIYISLAVKKLEVSVSEFAGPWESIRRDVRRRHVES
jgi:hypothetical protein